MKKPIAVLLAMVLLLTACGFAKADSEQPAAGERAEASGQETAETLKKSPEILAIYSCPATQIITGEDNTKELADTVIFLYKDLSYVQYVNHDNRYEVYSDGSFEMRTRLGRTDTAYPYAECAADPRGRSRSEIHRRGV